MISRARDRALWAAGSVGISAVRLQFREVEELGRTIAENARLAVRLEQEVTRIEQSLVPLLTRVTDEESR